MKDPYTQDWEGMNKEKQKPKAFAILRIERKDGCTMCGAKGVKLTKDHIIPKWLYNNAHFLGVDGFKKNLGQKNLQWLCPQCNQRKSGFIDVSHPLAQWFFGELRDSLTRKLKPYEERRKDT